MCIRDRCGQVKTIGAMEALLESYEREDYYRRSRRRLEPQNDRQNEPHRENRPRVNHVRSNNHHDNSRNQHDNRFQGRRRSFNNGQTYHNRYRREEENQHPQRGHSAEGRRSRSWEGRRDEPSVNQHRDEQERPTTSDGSRGNGNPQ